MPGGSCEVEALDRKWPHDQFKKFFSYRKLIQINNRPADIDRTNVNKIPFTTFQQTGFIKNSFGKILEGENT